MNIDSKIPVDLTIVAHPKQKVANIISNDLGLSTLYMKNNPNKVIKRKMFSL